MSKITTVTNEHQKYILSQLTRHQYARFSDIKPAKISSNSFSYHLKVLQNGGWIIKTEQGYTLGAAGLAFADRDSHAKAVRMQPNVTVALVVQDGEGNVLLHKKQEQPYIGQWELPSVAASVADTTVHEAGVWAAKQALRLTNQNVRHAGDCYVRVHKGKLALTAALVHVIRITLANYAPLRNYAWFQPLAVDAISHVPGVPQVIARAFFNDDFFFEEFTVHTTTQEHLAI